jgi:hypothetical protein
VDNGKRNAQWLKISSHATSVFPRMEFCGFGAVHIYFGVEYECTILNTKKIDWDYQNNNSILKSI